MYIRCRLKRKTEAPNYFIIFLNLFANYANESFSFVSLLAKKEAEAISVKISKDC